MSNFLTGATYSRTDIWQALNTDRIMPTRGPWFTSYVQIGTKLIAFLNLDTSGKTDHHSPNSYDPRTGIMRWYGKPNAHSAQPTFQNLFDGKSDLFVFAHWDSNQKYFTFMGVPQIQTYKDNVTINSKINTIEIILFFKSNVSDDEEHVPLDSKTNPSIRKVEGNRQLVLVNRYERDPSLRTECIKHFGAVCQICGFDFLSFYGSIGKNYCHVHHVTPLSEQAGPLGIDPIKDLIPVCPNCHSMLHRKIPALRPNELKDIIKINREQSKTRV